VSLDAIAAKSAKRVLEELKYSQNSSEMERTKVNEDILIESDDRKMPRTNGMFIKYHLILFRGCP